MSFREGMYSLIESLENLLENRVETGKRQRASIRFERVPAAFPGWLYIRSRCAVLASPAIDSADIVRDFDKTIFDTLKTIPYPALSVVSFGFKREKTTGTLTFSVILSRARRGAKSSGRYSIRAYLRTERRKAMYFSGACGRCEAERLPCWMMRKLIGTVRE